MEKPTITFDSQGRVRVLEAEKYAATEELQKEAEAFTHKVDEFSSRVHSIVESLVEHAGKIESAKMKAIGQRNLVDTERELRKIKARELRALIDERVSEYGRLSAELDALTRAEAEQRELLDKLAGNESGGV